MNPAQRSSPIPENASHEPQLCDETLVRAAKAGSHTAFADLQKIHSRRLFNRILSITRNHEDAEDALQETFFRAFRALPSFEGRSRFSTWLTRIAINSALMTIRRRRARPEVPLEQPLPQEDGASSLDVQDHALNPEEICDQKQRSQAILYAIDSLNPKLREPLRIRMAEAHSMKDLAQQLGVSLASVKSRLHRARKHLIRSDNLRNCGIWNAGNPESSHRRRKPPATPFTSTPRYQPLSESRSPQADSVYAG